MYDNPELTRCSSVQALLDQAANALADAQAVLASEALPSWEGHSADCARGRLAQVQGIASIVRTDTKQARNACHLLYAMAQEEIERTQLLLLG